MAFTFGKRSSSFFAMQRRISFSISFGSCGACVVGGTGSRIMIAPISSLVVSASKGRRPVTIS